ncbi:MAG: DEAD/DEAH box helicase [Candidatus Woesearchaeota archaeon]
MPNTVTYHETKSETDELDALLHPLVKKWFYSRFSSYSAAQLYGVYPIHTRRNILLSAPTGSTKTLTAFLSILNQLVDSALSDSLEDRVHAIYVSPLKALNADIQKNLLEPLAEMAKMDERIKRIRIATRTGDTSQYERQKMRKKPPHILITTPESLGLLLTTKDFQTHFSRIEWFIVDEIHSFIQDKRGVQLSLLMEQLITVSGEFCRVGLSATVHPLEEVAKFLVGVNRSCFITKVPSQKSIELDVVTPVSSLLEASYSQIHTKTYELLHSYIQSNKTVLVFTNSRAGTEQVVHTLKSLYPQFYYEINEEPPFEKSSLIGAHHGSIAQEQRREIEDKLKKGKLRCVVCSTSLELGIDIGFIDLVVLLDSPKSVSRLLQRIGRSGHKLDKNPKGVIIVDSFEDPCESSALFTLAKKGELEPLSLPKNTTDVLMQHVIGRCIFGISKKDLFTEVRRSYAFEELSESIFSQILHILLEESHQLTRFHVYPKLFVKDSLLYTKSSAIRIYRSNIGMIADSGAISVKIQDRIIGSIDEGFLEVLKPKDIFVLGGETYMYLYARGMTIQVREAYKKSPTVPTWFSQSLSLPTAVGEYIQKLFYELQQDCTLKKCEKLFSVQKSVQKELYSFIQLQHESGSLPTNQHMICEVFVEDEQVYYIFPTFHGKKMNMALALFFATISKYFSVQDTKIGATDMGFYIVAKKEIQLASYLAKIPVDTVETVYSYILEKNEGLKYRFRQSCVRAQCILRQYGGQAKSVGKQQMASHMLFHSVKTVYPDFFLLEEAKRELSEDVLDVSHATVFVKKLMQKSMKFSQKKVRFPSIMGIHVLGQIRGGMLEKSQKREYIKNMYHLHLAAVSLEKGKKKESLKVSIPEHTSATFNYHEYWQDSLKDTDEPKKSQKDVILADIQYAMQKIDVESDIQFELLRLLEGETDGFSAKFTHWLRELLSGPVPSFWSDTAIFFLQQKMREIQK